jgi:cytochrome c oxidase cbb3-type subunit 3
MSQKILYLLIITMALSCAPHAGASRQNLTDHDPGDKQIVVSGAPILIYESPYSLSETVTQVKRAITNHNFEFIRQQTVDGVSDTDTQNEGQDTIIYFCNFNKLDTALKLDKRVGIFLPCQISIIQRDGKVYILSVNPKALNALFWNQRLDSLCDELSQQYRDISEEVLL